MKPDISYLPFWLTAKDLARLLGVSKRTIRRWHAQGRIPPPYQFTRRTLRWQRADINCLFVLGPQVAGSFGRVPKRR